jgi:hypothetical protein
MTVSTSIPQVARPGGGRRVLIVAVLTMVIAVTAWAVATYAVGSGTRSTTHGGPSLASALSDLTPQQRHYVLGIAAMTTAQQRAAFGTDRPSGESSGLASLTPKERQYVQAIAAMSGAEQSAAFGTGR